MDASPTHHQHQLLLADQCLSSRNIATANTTSDNNEFIPHSFIELSAHGILDSSENNLQSSNSLMSIHDDKRGRKMPTTNSTSFNHVQTKVRREKISKKMKTLQAIVPGCDKITGKAHMLDEVINYVQSLQNEIQILSLKLASVNPIYDYEADLEAFTVKPHQIMTTNQQQQLSFHEYQMPCMLSQNHEEALWELEEQRQGLDDDLFAIINYNSLYEPYS
ncbi:myc-type, basic helix-loop-helix (bHLH) domain-containing protein [Artemisia annua]|uniref:Myc-type, basic helix-loop-helix (BHLH) domain-containing protein n=1 Tax=Artemisia annua TaxID=35608 RepID=A0A2U1PD56_ARTAN|nr:myc-type, basic helix-loop-helix (bHLH) domain-containing protein [Artemisia annua]